jgi:branched-chain amino acid transport system ATP-binding protein
MEKVESVLTTIELTKRFGGLIALNNVNIKISRNSLTLLIGPNGAGKSTFINTCMGVLKPDKGKIFFSPNNNGSVDITGWPPHRIYRLGFVRSFQIPQPFLSLTVLENILTVFSSRGENPLYAPIRPVWKNVEEENIEKAFRVLKLVGLDNNWDIPTHKLGAGQLKMLEVARALAANAKLVALDEPIGGTDPAYAKSIFERLRAIKSSIDITFLVVEHRIDIALPFADYVYVMDRGSVIAEGSPGDIYKHPKVVEVYLGE